MRCRNLVYDGLAEFLLHRPTQTRDFTNQENTMKAFRLIFAAYVLVFTLALSVFGGDMSTPLAPPQPASAPAPAGGEMSTPVNGDMHTGNSDEATTGDAVVAGALSLLQGVLSLL
jgi:hypothetical protein